MRRYFGNLIILIGLCFLANVLHAGVIYDISMSTAPLLGHAAGPFAIEFQLNDGRGTGDGNNTAYLSNFMFGTGAVVGSPTLNGGASGSAATSITLKDSSFLNQFIQTFTPGSLLGFRLTLSTNVDAGGTPDQFTFSILDSTGAELPTKSPFDVFVEVDIDSANPSVQTFGTDASRLPIGGGPPIDISPPSAVPSSVPEPETRLLLVAGLAAIAVVWLMRTTRPLGIPFW